MLFFTGGKMEYFIEGLKEFLTYDLLRTLFIESFKAGITLLFAYISFRFFQNYKEKSQNNKVYIKMLKLNDDIRRNIEKIYEVLELYKEGERLQRNLKIQGSNEVYYYDIAHKISEIINLYYIDRSYIDFYQELVEVYYFDRYPIQSIAEMSNEIEYIKQGTCDPEEIAIAENEFDYIAKKDIFNDLKELYDLISKADKEKKLDKVNCKLFKFNNKEVSAKNKELDEFCQEIFLRNKTINEIKEKYKRYNFLVGKVITNDKKENIKLNFKRFTDSDGVLSEYNAEFYFRIEDILEKYNNKEILLNDRNILENTCKELEQYKCDVEKEINIIKKKIDSTKRFFGR